MNWVLRLYEVQPIAQAIGVIALVCVAGMSLGSIKVRGIGLGTSGVLFAGIVAGHFGHPVDHAILDFVKEFGLILFVFTIGLQLGPGFFAALRSDGLRLNAMAVAIVVFGAFLAVLLGGMLHMDFAAALGMLAGATTNTPSLGAVQQTLATLPGISPDRLALPAVAYAVSYPAAIVGIIGTLLGIKLLFRIDPASEAAAFAEQQRQRTDPLESQTFTVEQTRVVGTTLKDLAARTASVISRYRRAGEPISRPVTGQTAVQLGDTLVAVGTRSALDRFEQVVGRRSAEDLRLESGPVSHRTIVVTHRDALGRAIEDLALETHGGAVISRVTRADIDLTAVPGLRLQFGDTVHVVGDPEGLREAERRLGNSVRELNQTRFIPLFLGILLGVLLGTLPLTVPGLPFPVQLGLAGGPLLVALFLGRFGRVGRLICHMPANANVAFREFGIALFFAAVGLTAGPKFFASVFSPAGLQWLWAGVCVTILPLLLGGLFARLVLKMNFTVLSGLLAGSVTDPPALTFANNLAGSDAPAVAYAAVYPLTMLLRILGAQILTLTLVR